MHSVNEKKAHGMFIGVFIFMCKCVIKYPLYGTHTVNLMIVTVREHYEGNFVGSYSWIKLWYYRGSRLTASQHLDLIVGDFCHSQKCTIRKCSFSMKLILHVTKSFLGAASKAQTFWIMILVRTRLYLVSCQCVFFYFLSGAILCSVQGLSCLGSYLRTKQQTHLSQSNRSYAGDYGTFRNWP